MDAERPILLCRPDRVGDVIIATSCLAALRTQRPDQGVVFAAREVMRPLLEGHPLLLGFVGLPVLTAPSARQKLADDFRRWEAAAYVGLHPDAACQAAARQAAIPRRVGYRDGFWLDRTLTDRVPDKRDTDGRHEAEHNFDLLAPLGVQLPPGLLRPEVHLPESWRRALRVRLAAAGWEDFDTKGGSPYAVVNPSAFAHDLRWPADSFAWIARELLASGRVERVVLVADSVNDPSIHQMRLILGPGVPGLIDLSGSTNLAELGWLLRFAKVLVSRNTGTTHLAAAVGCPLVELFGRLEPRYGAPRWRSLGERTEIVTCPPLSRRWNESQRAFWQRGHATIRREDVLAAALRLVDNPALPEE